MMSKTPKGAVEEILTKLTNEQAKNFILTYIYYIEYADDLVDGESIDRLLAVKNFTSLAIQVFNHPYYVRYREALCMVEVNNNINYFTSVSWEKSNASWKRRDAKMLARSGIEMIFAVLVVELGIEQARPLCEELREIVHLYHYSDGKVGKNFVNETNQIIPEGGN